MRELVDQPQIQGFEYRMPRLNPLSATADREPWIDLVPTVRNAFEELAIVGIIAIDLVSRQHIGEVAALVALGLEDAARQHSPRVEHAARINTGQPIPP